MRCKFGHVSRIDRCVWVVRYAWAATWIERNVEPKTKLVSTLAVSGSYWLWLTFFSNSKVHVCIGMHSEEARNAVYEYAKQFDWKLLRNLPKELSRLHPTTSCTFLEGKLFTSVKTSIIMDSSLKEIRKFVGHTCSLLASQKNISRKTWIKKRSKNELTWTPWASKGAKKISRGKLELKKR